MHSHLLVRYRERRLSSQAGRTRLANSTAPVRYELTSDHDDDCSKRGILVDLLEHKALQQDRPEQGQPPQRNEHGDIEPSRACSHFHMLSGMLQSM